MNLYVISGGPGTGKTTTIESLRKEGFGILEETARKIAEKKFPGKSVKEINPKDFQEEIFKLQVAQIEKIKDDKRIFFSDRGIGDTIAFYKLRVGQAPKEMWKYAKKIKYRGIFILDFLPFYEKDILRQEDEEEQKKIHEEIIKTYKELGYDIVRVPFMSVKDRVNFIKSKVFREI